MILNKDIIHNGKTLVNGKDINPEVLIRLFNDSLKLSGDGVNREYKRLFDSNTFAFDATSNDKTRVISIDTDIGTILIFNLLELYENISSGEENICRILMKYLQEGLYEEKLNMLNDEGRIVYKGEDGVIVDGIEYKINDNSFIAGEAVIEKEVNTYIFERLVKSAVIECNVPYEEALNSFLALTCDFIPDTNIH